MTTIHDNLKAVTGRISKACAAVRRDQGSVALLAVSKTWPAAAVLEAAQAGQQAFGENYVQEAVDKIRALAAYPELRLEWHFIGPLQSNKTRLVAENFAWVHSIDRLKIAQRLSEQRPAGMPPLQVCVQVNVSGEGSKSGCEPNELMALIKAVAALPHLRLRGLMAVPEATDDSVLLRSRFALLRQWQTELNAQGYALDTLSMGMSHDMDLAIEEGSTMVRVGTAIFGARSYPAPTN